jgi:hypothetical protein
VPRVRVGGVAARVKLVSRFQPNCLRGTGFCDRDAASESRNRARGAAACRDDRAKDHRGGGRSG